MDIEQIWNLIFAFVPSISAMVVGFSSLFKFIGAIKDLKSGSVVAIDKLRNDGLEIIKSQESKLESLAAYNQTIVAENIKLQAEIKKLTKQVTKIVDKIDLDNGN